MELINKARRIRFGLFEMDLDTGELRKAGVRIRLQDQPFKVLAILLERPGELVTREELKQRLWSESEFGDFDQGINVAIKKIRTALGEASENPVFIETLARRGYRFIAPVTGAQPSFIANQPVVEAVAHSHSKDILRRWAVLAALLALALVACGLLILRRPHEYALGVFGRTSDFRLAPLTSSLGYEFDPQFSPDGKQIAYAWTNGKAVPPNIFVKVLGAGNPVRLMQDQENVFRGLPAWSPDGRYIACIRGVRPPEIPPDEQKSDKNKTSVAERMMRRSQERRPDMGIYLLPAVGGEEKKLFDITRVSDLKWWPDGKGFLISTRTADNEPNSLYRFSLDGTERKRLTFPPVNFAGDSIPAFSPDGKLIAFSRNWTSGGSDIFIMPASGGEPRRITQDAHHLRGITFTADGRELVYSSARQAGFRRALWRVSVNGGTPVRLPFGTDNADAPVVAATGGHLAYIQVNQSAKIWAYDIPQPGTSSPTPPPEPRLLIGSRQMQVGPQYSPDGKRIVFTSDRTGSWELWVSAADGTNAVQLTSFGDRQTGTPRWSPDGKLIVFDSRPQGHSDIFVIDGQGGTPRRVTSSGEYDNVVPSFSRDGKWVYYSSNANGTWELWKTPASGQGTATQLTKAGGFSAFESFDGRALYYSKWDKPGIYSMPVSGGTETLVTIELLPRLWGSWVLREKGIYLIRPAEKPDTKEIYPELGFVDFDTKRMEHVIPLKDVPNPGPSISVSPDGKTLLYTEADDGGSDIMIVDDFR